MIESLPNRPLYAYQVTALDNEDTFESVEPLYHKEDDINGVIGILIVIDGSAVIVGYNNEDEKWEKLSKIKSETESTSERLEISESIIPWFEEKYDAFGVYGIDK